MSVMFDEVAECMRVTGCATCKHGKGKCGVLDLMNCYATKRLTIKGGKK